MGNSNRKNYYQQKAKEKKQSTQASESKRQRYQQNIRKKASSKTSSPEKIEYVRALMEANRQNKNITANQHQFLKTLASIRHNLHQKPAQYFYNTEFTDEVDVFFTTIKSMKYIQSLNIPYPESMIQLFGQLQFYKNQQTEDFGKSVQNYAFTEEKLNDAIEHYLRAIDKEKGTKYAPTGVQRNPNLNPVNLTMQQIMSTNQRVFSSQKQTKTGNCLPIKEIIEEKGEYAES